MGVGLRYRSGMNINFVLTLGVIVSCVVFAGTVNPLWALVAVGFFGCNILQHILNELQGNRSTPSPPPVERD